MEPAKKQKTCAAECGKPCAHKHLKFKNQGAVLACVDCPRSYHIVMPGGSLGGIPDVGYSHPELSEIEGRHTPYEFPRPWARPQPLPKKKSTRSVPKQ